MIITIRPVACPCCEMWRDAVAKAERIADARKALDYLPDVVSCKTPPQGADAK